MNTQINVLSFSQQVNIFFAVITFILYTYIRTLSADISTTTLLILSSLHNQSGPFFSGGGCSSLCTLSG